MFFPDKDFFIENSVFFIEKLVEIFIKGDMLREGNLINQEVVECIRK